LVLNLQPQMTLILHRVTKKHLKTQSEPNDLVSDVNLTENNAEILGLRLQQGNLLSEDVRIMVSLKINYKPED
jgi:hypothetical protein